MSTDAWQPPRFCPECGHKSGSGPCSTCKPYGAACTWCLHAGPVPVDIAITPPLAVAAVASTADDLPEYRLPRVNIAEAHGQRIEDINGVLCLVLRDATGDDMVRIVLPSTLNHANAVEIAQMHQRGLARQHAAREAAKYVRGQS